MLLISTVPLIGSAQVPTRKVVLKGKVLDQNRAAVSGASISVEREGREVPFTTTTDERGEFSVEVEVGPNKVTALAEGFAAKFQSVNLKANNSAPMEIILEVADATAIVTVTDASGYLTEALSTATKTATPLLTYRSRSLSCQRNR